MNFSTDLPKSDPIVSYIVASAIWSSFPTPGKVRKVPCFRMHAVILKDRGIHCTNNIGSQVKLNGGKGLILCHIRQVAAIPGELNSQNIENCSDWANKGEIQIAVGNSLGFPLAKTIKPELELSNPLQLPALKSLGMTSRNTGISAKRPKMSFGYFHSSRMLMRMIDEYGIGNYQELYKKLQEEGEKNDGNSI
jgi:hypothetical protein